MKKLLTSLCLLLCAVATWAAKANSTPVTITQPDGTQLTIILHGDEHANWYTSLDGTLLVQSQRAYYVAKVKADGTLASTGLLAHRDGLRTAAELQAVAAQDKPAFYAAATKKAETARRVSIGTKATPHYFPHTGSPKALVLLVEFSDTTFSLTNPKESFNQYLNGDGELKNLGANEDKNYGSALQYFKEMSGGAFTPQFDIYGPYKLDSTSATYGAGQSDRMDLLIPDACKAADQDVNFADYDADGDGYVDLVYIIYAGYSANYGDNLEEYIWPKSGSGSYGTYDNVKVSRYGVNNELIASPGTFSKAPLKRINGVGLFVHEFSHTLGLPDLYPISSTAVKCDNQGMEYWSVMDGGENNFNGYYPTAYTAWEREVLGWYAPDTLADTCSVAGLAPLSAEGGKAYKVFNGNTQEHVMLENVQQTGWNTKLKGHGLLAYRISYSKSEVNLGDKPNDTAGKPEVVVLAADGLLKNVNNCTTANEYYEQMAGDTYPGTFNVTSIKSFTMLDGSSLEKPVLNIAESEAGLISFDFLGQKQIVDGITAPTIVGNAAQSIYTLDGRFAGTDRTRLPKGLYIIGGKKFVKD